MKKILVYISLFFYRRYIKQMLLQDIVAWFNPSNEMIAEYIKKAGLFTTINRNKKLQSDCVKFCADIARIMYAKISQY